MQYLLIILKYLPLVIQAVQAIETLMGDTVSGEAKKALIIESVKGTAANLQVTGVIKTEDLQALNAMVDAVVSVANTFGILGKAKKK